MYIGLHFQLEEYILYSLISMRRAGKPERDGGWNGGYDITMNAFAQNRGVFCFYIIPGRLST